ncbi:MAG: ATP-binding protein [Pirellulales bacterium]
MPENEISQVFSPFFRSDIARERGVPGSGLGLAVVERIAASLDIKVTLQTAENIGTNVILEIPVEPFSANRFRGVV